MLRVVRYSAESKWEAERDEEAHKGTKTPLCFVGIFSINMCHIYDFKMLILMTETRTKAS